MRLLRLILAPLCLLLIIGFSSCNPDGSKEPSVEELQLKALSNGGTITWTVSEVKYGEGDTDRTSEFSGMTLRIDGTLNNASSFQYTVNNRPALSPWPASGNWEFGLDPGSQIIRLDSQLGGLPSRQDVQIVYLVTSSQLQLIFTHVGDGFNGRVDAVLGEWTFLFSK